MSLAKSGRWKGEGFVYLVRNDKDHSYKIGCFYDVVEKKVAELQMQNPKLQLLMKVKANEMSGAETAALDKLMNDLGMVKLQGAKDWVKKGQKCKEQDIIECVRQAVYAHNQKTKH